MTLLARTGIVNTYATAFSATGGTTTDSGGYRYHTFNSSGNFVVTGSKSMDILVVGGGGNGSGMGGAAGMFSTSTQTVGIGTYTVTVGAGGSNPSSIRSNGSGETTYNIGDTGPAGGTVFITPSTAGNTTGRYFEVAPIAYRVSRPYVNSAYSSYWMTNTDDRTIHAQAVGIGSGERNTNSGYFQKHLTMGTLNVDATGVNNAFAYCYNFVYGGYSDWFMPSSSEAGLLPSSYTTGVSMWTSNEGSNSTGGMVGGSFVKTGTYSVVPVRSFTVSTVTPVYALGGGNFGNSTYTSAPYEGNYFYSFQSAGGGGATGRGQYYTYPGGGATGGAGGSGATWNSFKSYGGGGGGGAQSYFALFSGGAGGSNGGGAGGSASSSSLTNGVSGTANSGGGGGGYAEYYDSGTKSYFQSTPGSGGSGTVIVRYLL